MKTTRLARSSAAFAMAAAIAILMAPTGLAHTGSAPDPQMSAITNAQRAQATDFGQRAARAASPRETTPWVAGGQIGRRDSQGQIHLCSTAALGSYEKRWALLTAAHCVDWRDGTEVLALLDGTNWVRIGVSTRVVSERDQAFVVLDDQFQKQMSSRFFGVFVDERGTRAEVAPGYSITKTGERWYKSGRTTGWTTSTATEVDEKHVVADSRRIKVKYHVNACGFGTGGDSGAGLFKFLNGRYHLLGVLSVGRGSCTTRFTEAETVIQNGFSPFRAP